ncbi:hypothetical protein [Bacillus sp. NEB1478]|uniref:hypothetical protein n=1 Tax=Bacillus sp. NEB1478 TaxID=3073816 RepID=UPI002872DC12|nr:hypothetical protein [Bacillus sp. NEB1478]WNB93369.1 hypothetical protein RGB74_06790 [Bacillus sp. NEB1478]
MILLMYIVINVVAIIFFTKTKNNLHILEIIVYWLIGSYLFQNYSALCYMNFKTLIIPDKLTYELTHFINRIVLYPLIMVSFLRLNQFMNTTYKKILSIISCTLILTGLEWIEDFLGVLVHVHWQIWWSFSFWLTTLCVLLGCMKLFRKSLYKKWRAYS